MYRRHPFTSRDILRPKVAEQMPLRQQQARGPRRFQPGLHVISALTGERRAGPSQLRPLPLGRQRGRARAAGPEGIRPELTLAQLIPHSWFEFGLGL